MLSLVGCKNISLPSSLSRLARVALASSHVLKHKVSYSPFTLIQMPVSKSPAGSTEHETLTVLAPCSDNLCDRHIGSKKLTGHAAELVEHRDYASSSDLRKLHLLPTHTALFPQHSYVGLALLFVAVTRFPRAASGIHRALPPLRPE